MKKNTCPSCKEEVDRLNEQCRGCGFHIVMEPDDVVRAQYLRRPSLGALLFTQGWAVGARTYIWFLLSLIPIVGIVALIVLTLFGRRMSWERGGWASWDEFQSRMRMMDLLGVIWVAGLVLFYVLARS